MPVAYVLSDGSTATTDYFLYPHLESLGYTPSLLDTSKPFSNAPFSSGASLVVISRYLPYAWRNVLGALKKGGSKIVYFMDDDLFDIQVLRGLPWRYRWKILRLAMGQQRRLKELCNEFWVSTPFLAQKYADLKPCLVQAAPPPRLINSPSPLVHICYHATASHGEEISWLADVVLRVQSRSENTHFELFGDATVKRYYRGIPRVSILHAMKWPEYLAWSGAVRRDIALAPILPTAFNTGRGPTKFFDYARLGAAGIYSDALPYRGFIRHGVDGILIGNDPELWARTILELVGDAEVRMSMAASARMRALGASGEAETVYSLPSLSTGS